MPNCPDAFIHLPSPILTDSTASLIYVKLFAFISTFCWASVAWRRVLSHFCSEIYHDRLLQTERVWPAPLPVALNLVLIGKVWGSCMPLTPFFDHLCTNNHWGQGCYFKENSSQTNEIPRYALNLRKQAQLKAINLLHQTTHRTAGVLEFNKKFFGTVFKPMMHLRLNTGPKTTDILNTNSLETHRKDKH